VPSRREKRNIFGLMDKDIVRLIMSKFEILLNGKINVEQEKLYQKRDEVIHLRHKDWIGIVIAYFPPRLLTEIMR
jgi:hypothetical protein